MPFLLSRFLGKKKNADPAPLLDGEKYEVVVPKTPSPSAPAFPEFTQRPMSPSKSKTKEQSEKSFGIPIRRKQPSSNVPTESKVKEKLPMLSLHLPETKLEEKKLQGLGVVFEGITDGPPRLDDDVLGAKRLTAPETLTLVQKTSEVISERALETLGVMRPHWFASPRQQEVQLQLITRFLQTLSGSQTNGTATGSTSSPATFESELRYTRDPHDVAAVLRWGLRHLQLDGNSFGSSSSVDWYRSFVDSERSESYPSKAFDDILVPLLPASHAQLLRATLDLVSSLAAHSEENGISGNKLSKVLGWWIVSSRNVQGLGWREFYKQWEAAARQFEHIFLAYIRAQQAQSRMPKRLTELVKNYPYTKNRREDDGIFLPRSRFTTRSATALFVRVTVDKSSALSRPHPLRIVEDAFKADAESDSADGYVALWQTIRTIASKLTPSGDESKDKSETGEAEASLNLSTILADETIRLLSLVPAPDGPSGPTLSLYTSLLNGRPRRSYSVGDRSPTTPVANGSTQGHLKDGSSNDKATGSPSASNRELDVATDWQAFSNAGFHSPSGLSLAASLWDTDTEVSQPTPKKGAGSGKRNLSVKSSPSRRASADSPLALPSAPSSQPGRLTYGVPQIVKLDEAFIDFWADTLLDSIARSWPTFVVCQLKAIPTLRLTESDKLIEWLVIERVIAEPTRSLPLPVKTSTASARTASPTPASPTRSEGSKSRWTATTLAATRKRWSLFSHKHESAPAVQRGRDLAVRTAAKSANVGEMGEILREEDEERSNGVAANGRTTVNGTKEINGMKESDVLKKEAEKKQDLMPSQPTIPIEGVSKPEDPVTMNYEEVIVTKDITPTAAELTSLQDLVAVVDEPSDNSKQVVEAPIHSSQLPTTTEVVSEVQTAIEPSPMKEPAAESVPQAPVATAVVAEPQTSPKDDVALHPPVETTVPEPHFLEEQMPVTPDLELKEQPQVPVPAAEQAEPTRNFAVIHQKHSVEAIEDSSLEKDHVISVSDVPDEADAVPPSKEMTFEDAQGSTEPVALEDAIVKRLQSSVTDTSPSAEPEITLLSKPLVVESAISEPQHSTNGVAAVPAEEPLAGLNSVEPEAVPAAAPEEAAATFSPVETHDVITANVEAEVVELTTAEDAEVEVIDADISPDVPAEPIQQPEILETLDTEHVPIDEDWLANAEPALSEPYSEISTDGPTNIDPESAADDIVIGDTAEAAS